MAFQTHLAGLYNLKSIREPLQLLQYTGRRQLNVLEATVQSSGKNLTPQHPEDYVSALVRYRKKLRHIFDRETRSFAGYDLA